MPKYGVMSDAENLVTEETKPVPSRSHGETCTLRRPNAGGHGKAIPNGTKSWTAAFSRPICGPPEEEGIARSWVGPASSA